MTPVVRMRGRELDLARPVLMGIVNATPDSFSDPPGIKGADELAARALELIDDGAAIVDVGGESGRTDTQAVPVEEEIARVVPVVERLARRGALVSVDTWRAPVARAALEAGAAMINDVSGLSDPALAEACAASGAGLVITHTRAAPKTKAFPHYDDVVADVCAFLDERMDAARAAGVDEDCDGARPRDRPREDAGAVDRAAAQAAGDWPRWGGRCCWPCRARTSWARSRSARRRTATRARSRRWARRWRAEPSIVRVHDVAGARDYLRVREALVDGAESGLELAPELRREAV